MIHPKKGGSIKTDMSQQSEPTNLKPNQEVAMLTEVPFQFGHVTSTNQDVAKNPSSFFNQSSRYYRIFKPESKNGTCLPQSPNSKNLRRFLQSPNKQVSLKRFLSSSNPTRCAIKHRTSSVAIHARAALRSSIATCLGLCEEHKKQL